MSELCEPRAKARQLTRETVFQVHGLEDQSRTIRLRAARCTIGSAANCTLRLRAAGVHPVQCLIVRGEAATIVRRYTADTLLNGRGFDDAVLSHGDRLRIGPVELEWVDPALAVDQSAEASVVPLPAPLAPSQDSRLRELQAELATRAAQSAAWKEQCEAWQERCRGLEDSTGPTEARLRRLESELSAAQAALAEREAAWAEQRQTLVLQRQALDEQQQALSAGLAELAAKQRSLADGEAALAARGSQSESEHSLRLADIERREAALRQACAALEARQVQEQAGADSATRGLEAERARLAAEAARLADAQAELRGKQEQLAAGETALAAQKQSLAERQANETARLANEWQELTAAREACDRDRQSLAAERSTLADTQAALVAAQAALDQERRKVAAEAQSLALERQALDAQRQSLADDRQSFEQLEKQLAVAQQSLAHERDALTSQQENLATARQALAEAQEALATERSTLDEERKTLASEREQLAAQRAEIIGDREELARGRDMLETQHRELECRRAALEPTGTSNASVADDVATYQPSAEPAPAEDSGAAVDLASILSRFGRKPETTAEQHATESVEETADEVATQTCVTHDASPEVEEQPIASQTNNVARPTSGRPDWGQPRLESRDVTLLNSNKCEEPGEIVEPSDAAPAPARDAGAQDRESGEQEDHDEAVQAYMARLLGKPRHEIEAMTARRERSAPAETPMANPRAAQSVEAIVTSDEPAAEMAPRGPAPERQVDLSALRQVANISAQSALDRHARGKLKQRSWAKLTITAAGFGMAALLGWLWYEWDFGPRALYGALAGLGIGLIYGVQSATLAVRIIVSKARAIAAQHVALTGKPHADPTTAGDETTSSGSQQPEETSAVVPQSSGDSAGQPQSLPPLCVAETDADRPADPSIAAAIREGLR